MKREFSIQPSASYLYIINNKYIMKNINKKFLYTYLLYSRANHWNVDCSDFLCTLKQRYCILVISEQDFYEL